MSDLRQNIAKSKEVIPLYVQRFARGDNTQIHHTDYDSSTCLTKSGYRPIYRHKDYSFARLKTTRSLRPELRHTDYDTSYADAKLESHPELKHTDYDKSQFRTRTALQDLWHIDHDQSRIEKATQVRQILVEEWNFTRMEALCEPTNSMFNMCYEII